jgi:D-sedoheptulose 7-phosphate isomerase
MKQSLLRKAHESAAAATALIERDADKLEACARAMAARFERGGRLWAFGNGGSACDAQHIAIEFLHPILEKRRALPAQALGTAPASLTAIANDGDFALVYAEELQRLARPEDIALGISTSGESANVLRGIEAARALGLMTIAFSGRDGGRLAARAEHAFVAPSFSIHRIQETHVLLVHLLWDQLHLVLGEPDVL